jgi:hypothetical protein
MNNEEVKNLCMSLMKADSENEVIDILRSYNYWENESVWRYYGDYENNFNTIGNQQSSPEAALVEKIINSIDARLMNECVLKGFDPEADYAPKTIREAVALFFDGENNPNSNNAGKIKNWDLSKRTEIAKGVTLATTGYSAKNGNPSITITDNGEGQTPDMMPYTLLSLTKSNKLRIPFVHGKFNMGGTGVLKFCGYNNLQLIISRRNPKFVDGECPNDSAWGFTIVRREYPFGSRRSSVYTYLAPIECERNPFDGKVLSFFSEKMPIYPVGNNPYVRESEYGTLIKLYEYAIPNKSHILRRDGLLYRIDLLLPNVALPIRIHECRQTYGGHPGSFETSITGLTVRLDDDRNSNIEETWSFSMYISGEKIHGTIYALKSSEVARTYMKNEGILFTVNGQTHGCLSNDFIDRAGLGYIANRILIIADCSEFSQKAIEDCFMNSRDRLRKGVFYKEIEDELKNFLKRHDGLRAFNEKIHREMINSKLNNAKPLEKVLENILKKSPTLSSLFIAGNRVPTPFKSINVADEEKPFIGKKYPSYFKVKGIEYGKVLHKDCHINMRCRIQFETDAENDYFTREDNEVSFEVFFIDDESNTRHILDYTLNLNNGIATLSMKLPSKCCVGDLLHFKTILNDETQVFPYENSFNINVKEAQIVNGGNGERRTSHGNKHGKDREVPSGIFFEDPREIYEKDWNTFTPALNRFSALKLINNSSSNLADESDNFEFWINMDNSYLQSELKGNTKDISINKARFKYGLSLIAISMLQYYKELKNKNTAVNDDDEININRGIESFCQAVAPVIIPMITSLGGLDITTQDEYEEDTIDIESAVS